MGDIQRTFFTRITSFLLYCRVGWVHSNNINLITHSIIDMLVIYVRGWRTMSGCTWVVYEGMMSPLNGLERPMLSWNGHMAKLLKERV
jgi:hypothetical protein